MAARPRRSLGRFRVMVTSVTTLVQVPAVWTLGRWIGNVPLVAAGAALLTLPYLYGLRSPFDDRPKRALYLYGALYPFFMWWVACLAFAVLAPLAAVIGWASGAPSSTMLGGAAALSLLAGVLSSRREPALIEHEVIVEGLPAELDGYRVAHISDIHCGSYVPPERVARWVERLNAAGPDLVAVTGDLISSGARHVEAVAQVLGRLRGRDGVFACMGNHDYFVEGDQVALALERHGVRLLRNRGQVVRMGLYVAGADDTWTRRHDVPRALADRPPGAFTVLLAHDPNLFGDAVAGHVELTLSGHTHGGQIAVPWLARHLTLARLITPFTSGLYRVGRSVLYVNRGAGTTGPPIRLGARAELALLTLRPR